MSNSKPRICLVSASHLATNPRLVKESQALKSAGYDVSVIVGRFLEWAERSDATIPMDGITVTQCSYGPRAAGAAPMFARLRRRLCWGLPLSAMAIPGVAERALHPAVPELARAAASERADLYIGHTIPGLIAAAMAARTVGGTLGFDAEDLHAEDTPDDADGYHERTLIELIEHRYLPRVQHLTASSPGIARAYQRLRHDAAMPVPTVLNVFPRGEMPERSTPHGSAEPSPSIYWFSQTIGPDRGLETLLAGAAQAKAKPHLYLRGKPIIAFQAELVARAKACGMAERLHFLAPAPPGDMLREASRFDIGAATEIPVNRNRDVCLTNKLFTYLGAGMAIVASATTAQLEMAGPLRGAVKVYPPGDAIALSACLDAFLLDPGALPEARQSAFRLAQDQYNWDTEQMNLLDSVARVLERRSA